MRKALRNIVVITLLILHGVTALCPDSCTCQEAVVGCQNAGMTSVPDNLNEDTILIDLSQNNISIIDNSAFENVQNVRTILLNDNSVEVIEPGVFSSLYDLWRLDLRDNNIELLHPSVFQNNPNLTFLDLSGNSIEELNIDFNSNIEIKYLNLSRNFLNFQAVASFLPIVSLQTLDLSHNNLETLSAEVFEGMVQLLHLDLTGNTNLDYDCNLRTLWSFCSEKSVKCVTDDINEWRNLENLECEVEPEAMSLTDGYLEVNESVSEDTTFEGSGSIDVTETTEVEGSGDIDRSVSEVNDTGILSSETGTTSSDLDWMLIGIIAGSVVCGLIIIIVAVICIVRYKKSRVSSVGNLSHAHSFDYLNQDDEFNRSYKNPRKESNRTRTNHYDRVLPPGYGRDVLQLHVSDNVAAEVTRVPSFKARGIATPLNLPEEITPTETGLVIQNKGVLHNSESQFPDHPLGSLPRSSQSSYEGNNTIRAGSIKKYVKPDAVTNPHSQYSVSEIRRIPSTKRS